MYLDREVIWLRWLAQALWSLLFFLINCFLHSHFKTFQRLQDEHYICHSSGNPQHKFIHGFYLYNIVSPKDKPKSGTLCLFFKTLISQFLEFFLSLNWGVRYSYKILFKNKWQSREFQIDLLNIHVLSIIKLMYHMVYKRTSCISMYLIIMSDKCMFIVLDIHMLFVCFLKIYMVPTTITCSKTSGVRCPYCQWSGRERRCHCLRWRSHHARCRSSGSTS